MVSGVSASRNFKQLTFFFLSICFLFRFKIIDQIELLFCFKIDVLLLLLLFYYYY